MNLCTHVICVYTSPGKEALVQNMQSQLTVFDFLFTICEENIAMHVYLATEEVILIWKQVPCFVHIVKTVAACDNFKIVGEYI